MNIYNKITKPYRVLAMDVLKKLISIPSVFNASTSNKKKPFGEEINNALTYIGSIAEQYGFDVDYCDGYATEISFGEGERLVCIFAHLDVVEVSGKWDTDPFELVIKKDVMYGRGTIDDKGPGVAAFFALKALKDNGLIKNFRVKLIFGGDEERGGSCLDYYFNVLKKEKPTYGFTPDADFPLIYGEKGVTNFVINKNIELKNIISIEGGRAPNIGIDECKVTIKSDARIKEFINVRNQDAKVNVINEDTMEIVFYGKPCHGATPELGDNAAIKMAQTLGDYYDYKYLKDIYYCFKDVNGRNFNGYKNEPILKETTYNCGLISFQENMFKLTVNFRYPENTSVKLIMNNLENILSSEISYDEIGEYLLFPLDSFLVKTLLSSYKEETLKLDKPFTIGGGTYAKSAANTIAFGPAIKDKNYHMHEANEEFPIKEFYDAMGIYARAIHKLGTDKDESKI